jgi:hypothetical protein
MKFAVNGSSPLMGEARRGWQVADWPQSGVSPSPDLSHRGKGGLPSVLCGFVADRVLNNRQDSLEVISYLRVPKSQHAKSLPGKKFISNFIILIVQVLAAISFNNQFVFKANKIQNVSTHRFLPAKLCIKVFAAQMFPQNSFFWSHITSQFASNICQRHSLYYETIKGI